MIIIFMLDGKEYCARPMHHPPRQGELIALDGGDDIYVIERLLWRGSDHVEIEIRRDQP